MRRRGRTDSNHAEIRDALRARGWKVRSLASVGDGMSDLLVHRPGTACVRLIEVKAPGGELTDDQKAFIAEGWPVTIIQSVEDTEWL